MKLGINDKGLQRIAQTQTWKEDHPREICENCGLEKADQSDYDEGEARGRPFTWLPDLCWSDFVIHCPKPKRAKVAQDQENFEAIDEVVSFFLNNGANSLVGLDNTTKPTYSLSARDLPPGMEEILQNAYDADEHWEIDGHLYTIDRIITKWLLKRWR